MGKGEGGSWGVRERKKEKKEKIFGKFG